MPRHGEISWQVAQLESKVEFMMENLFTKIDSIYEKSSQITCKIDRVCEISCSSDKNFHETEMLRQEISLLRIRLQEMANQPVQCSCTHNKSPSLKSPSLSDLTVALMETKKGNQPPSNTANLWKKLNKTYKTPKPQNLVDVKSIVAKFDVHHTWNTGEGESDVSRPASTAPSVVGTPVPATTHTPNQVYITADNISLIHSEQ
ncbi:uncharacterized protein LOC134825469 [Bolinopsis microptera]|uniref:uncharacterized protein LOC134825469 n=1 Tax=Bolinopsis microptera TaxID=2820187 RepID=UPI003079D4B0